MGTGSGKLKGKGKTGDKPLLRLTDNRTRNELTWLNEAEIEAVMAEQAPLRELVADAHQHLVDFFPGDVFSLRSSTDPEEPAPDALVLKVKTSKGYDEAVKAWTKFNEEWWLPNYDRADDRLRILLDF